MPSETLSGATESPVSETVNVVANPLPLLPPPSTAVPARVGIALLTLQLRVSLQEAAAAEAAGAGIDPDAALAELRARVEPLMEERRRSLDETLAQARADAAAAIAAAHREASAIVADVSEPVQPAAAEVVTVVPTSRQQTAMEVSTQFVPALPPINVVIDADAFARVFSTVLATVLEERAAALPPSRTQAPARRSFWTHALHPDVFLLGLAMMIVVVVLVAWLA